MELRPCSEAPGKTCGKAFEAAGAALGATADEVAETVGLMLERTPSVWSYEATPTRSLTFASTGSDGVHFGVLTGAGSPGPVVMTVPMNPDAPNVVVGADLRDFLALGCRVGYFALDELAYDRARTIQAIAAGAAHQPDKDVADVLAVLRERLHLESPTGVGLHLGSLEQRYGHLLT